MVFRNCFKGSNSLVREFKLRQDAEGRLAVRQKPDDGSGE